MAAPQTLVIATVGTSLLNNLRRAGHIPPDCLPDVREALGILAAREPSDRLCGAEINSLNNLIRGKVQLTGERTVRHPLALCLLVSDTDEGRWTGELLELYFGKWEEVEEVHVDRVEGLSHADAKHFAQTGLRNLVRQAAHWLRKYRSVPLRIIDATGGYKAQISFASVIGQALKVPVVYLFELFPYCIELPPLPVDFDRSLWLEHYWLFKRLSEEVAVPPNELPWADIAPQISSLLDRIEADGEELVALSPILELMHQSFLSVAPPRLEKAPDAGVSPADKINLSKTAHHGRPSNLDTWLSRLSQLPWVVSITYVRATPSPVPWRLHATEAGPINEIIVSCGDGEQSIKLRLQTTAQNEAQRMWCLEQLRELQG